MQLRLLQTYTNNEGLSKSEIYGFIQMEFSFFISMISTFPRLLQIVRGTDMW